jgi:hypothetical protein
MIETIAIMMETITRIKETIAIMMAIMRESIAIILSQ